MRPLMASLPKLPFHWRIEIDRKYHGSKYPQTIFFVALACHLSFEDHLWGQVRPKAPVEATPIC
jgi:hypothetical protein